MRFIAHRCQTEGPDPIVENNLEHGLELLDNGYDIEVDIWWADNDRCFYLGHSKHQYELLPHQITHLIGKYNDHIWFHCKDRQSLSMLLSWGVHCFWHQTDDYTLTSKGYIWTYPDKRMPQNNGILALPEKCRNANVFTNIAGICSDYIRKYKEQYETIRKIHQAANKRTS